MRRAMPLPGFWVPTSHREIDSCLWFRALARSGAMNGDLQQQAADKLSTTAPPDSSAASTYRW